MSKKSKITQFFLLFKQPNLLFNSLKTSEIEPKKYCVEKIFPITLLAALASAANVFLFNENATAARVCVQFLFEFLAVGATFFLCVFVCKKTVKNAKNISQSLLYQVVGTVFSFACWVNIFMDLTNMFFLVLFVFYATYLLWVVANEIFEMKENKRGKFLVINFLTLFVGKLAILKVLMFLVPNLK